MNAAIEAAARAQCRDGDFDPDEDMPNGGKRWLYYVSGAAAAIIAFLRNCEVTGGMEDAGEAAFENPDYPTDIFKAMATQLATELEGK